MRLTYKQDGVIVHECSIPLSESEWTRIWGDYIDPTTTDLHRNSLLKLFEAPPIDTWNEVVHQLDGNDELMPCPFCGGIPQLDDPDFIYPSNQTRQFWDAHCTSRCGGQMFGCSAQEVLQGWQRRPNRRTRARDFVTLMPDYSSTGIWSSDGVGMEYSDLPISDTLKIRITDWCSWYEHKPWYDDPGIPVFPDEEFTAAGLDIAKDIKRELPTWIVEYYYETVNKRRIITPRDLNDHSL